MKRKLFFWYGLLCFVTCLAKQEGSVNRYHIKISQNDIRSVEVEASLFVDKPILIMNNMGIPNDIPKGWANFVTVASITTLEGNLIEFDWNDSNHTWSLKHKENSRIKIKYSVVLSHDQHSWDTVGGIDGRPTLLSANTAFWRTNALFIFSPDPIIKNSMVNFEVPGFWKVSTPWQQKEGLNFFVENVESLSNNALMIGKHIEKNVHHDGMLIRMAISPDLASKSETISKVLDKVLPLYRNIFGELPNSTYLICVSEHSFEDGEAFHNSFHQLLIDKHLEDRMVVWGNVLAHEMFHYWNGANFLIGENPNTNSWFSEGFTEYYSNIALVRTGLITEKEYLQKLAYQFARLYTSQSVTKNGQPNLMEAGNDKVVNWHLIYGGGASIAFMLDVEIRTRTNGRQSLDDFMRLLYEKYGKQELRITLVDQIEALEDLTNSDFDAFFKKYVTGKEFFLLPILDACQKAGLVVAQYQGEFFLTKDENHFLFDKMIAP